MIIDNRDPGKKNRIMKVYLDAYGEALEALYALAQRDGRINLNKLKKAISKNFNIIYIHEVETVEKMGEACIYYNRDSRTGKWKDFECVIRLSSQNFKQADNKLLKNTLVHEIFHVMADTIGQSDQGHHGYWRKLANQYNKMHKHSMKVRKAVYLDEVMTAQELEEYDRKIYNESMPYKYEMYCPRCGMVYAQSKFRTKDMKHSGGYKCGRCHSGLRTRQIKSVEKP